METKETTLNRILKRIGLKNKPVALFEPKPKGVKIALPKPKAKPKAALVKLKPKKKKVAKVKAERSVEAENILKLVKTDPQKALALATAFDKKKKAERITRTKFLALSPLEQEREKERIGIIKAAAETLTANLPNPSEIGININWKSDVILRHLGEAAFKSALESDVLFISNGLGDLSVKVGAQTVVIHKNPELLDATAAKLWKKSGMIKGLDNPTTQHLIRAVGTAAKDYEVQQMKLKPSEYYLERLVANSIVAPLKFTKDTANRIETMAALTLAVAEEAIALGFYKNSQKTVQIDCSDNRFGSSEIPKKVLLPIMELIVKGSTVAGKLKSTKDPSKLMDGVINMLPL